MSTQPDPDGCDLDYGEDVGGALFVSGCDAPEPLEPDRHHLMGTRPGARTSVVEHAVSVVRIGGRRGRHALPHPGLCPA